MRVVCTGHSGQSYYTVGKIYNVVDGFVTDDDGDLFRLDSHDRPDFKYETLYIYGTTPAQEYEDMTKETGDSLKKDDGKPMLQLIEPAFIVGVGKVLSFGAKKYRANGWKDLNTVDGKERVKGALLRHTMKYLDGETMDEETGESHLHHMATNIMFLDYFDTIKCQVEEDSEGIKVCGND